MPSDSHDPYRRWLGITTSSRPLNFYELLGLPTYESDQKKIRDSIESKVSILQMVSGDEAKTAQEILKEIGKARSCLLNEDAKATYDAELRSQKKTGKSSRSKKRKKAWKESPPPTENLSIDSEDSPDNIQSRIKSQKVKEQQDRQIKVVLDRVMWISCGVCVIAIGWVMTARISGCNQDPTTIAKDEEANSGKKIQSKKISPQKKLDRSLISPLEKEAKRKLTAENSQTENKENKNRSPKKSGGKKKNSSGKKNGVNQKADADSFVSLKETIGYYDFDQAVTKNDLLNGLAPLRLRNVKWSRKSKSGLINLDAKSRVEIENEKAFDSIKKMTLLFRFKTAEAKRKQFLFSIKGAVVGVLDQGTLRIEIGDQEVEYKIKGGFANDKWHDLAITIGKQTRIWADGKFVKTRTVKLPEFSKCEGPSEIGQLTGTKDSNFIGQFERIGFYWIELNHQQIRSQFPASQLEN